MNRIAAVAGTSAVLAVSAIVFVGSSADAVLTGPQFDWNRANDQTVYKSTWPIVPTATRYQVFVDGKAGSVQTSTQGCSTAGGRCGFALPVVCDGNQHRINVRGGYVDATGKEVWLSFRKKDGKDFPEYFTAPAIGACSQ